MKFSELTSLKLIELLENATELFRNNKYHTRDYVEKYLGLSIHRSNFYGMEERGELKALKKQKTSFDSDEDVTLVIEGILQLGKIPVNEGVGDIVYSGYGVLEVDGNLIYDGRAGNSTGGGSDIYAESLTSEFTEQVVEGVSVGNAVDHRLETRNGRLHLVIGDPYQVPRFNSFSMSSQPQIIETGDSIIGGVRNFVWTTSNSSNITPNDISITDVNSLNVILSASANDGSESGDIGLPVQLLAGDTQSYRISSGQLQGADITRVFTISARWAIYYGNNSLVSLTESDVESLTKELDTGYNRTFNLNAGGYKWICYPTTFGTASNFTDTSNNFPVAMEPFGGSGFITVNITNDFGQTVDYKCHRTLNQLGSNINILVS